MEAPARGAVASEVFLVLKAKLSYSWWPHTFLGLPDIKNRTRYLEETGHPEPPISSRVRPKRWRLQASPRQLEIQLSISS